MPIEEWYRQRGRPRTKSERFTDKIINIREAISPYDAKLLANRIYSDIYNTPVKSKDFNARVIYEDEQLIDLEERYVKLWVMLDLNTFFSNFDEFMMLDRYRMEKLLATISTVSRVKATRENKNTDKEIKQILQDFKDFNLQ